MRTRGQDTYMVNPRDLDILPHHCPPHLHLLVQRSDLSPQGYYRSHQRAQRCQRCEGGASQIVRSGNRTKCNHGSSTPGFSQRTYAFHRVRWLALRAFQAPPSAPGARESYAAPTLRDCAHFPAASSACTQPWRSTSRVTQSAPSSRQLLPPVPFRR